MTAESQATACRERPGTLAKQSVRRLLLAVLLLLCWVHPAAAIPGVLVSCWQGGGPAGANSPLPPGSGAFYGHRLANNIAFANVDTQSNSNSLSRTFFGLTSNFTCSWAAVFQVAAASKCIYRLEAAIRQPSALSLSEAPASGGASTPSFSAFGPYRTLLSGSPQSSYNLDMLPDSNVTLQPGIPYAFQVTMSVPAGMTAMRLGLHYKCAPLSSTVLPSFWSTFAAGGWSVGNEYAVLDEPLDTAALKALYLAVGPFQTLSGGWDAFSTTGTQQYPCTWDGVTCSFFRTDGSLFIGPRTDGSLGPWSVGRVTHLFLGARSMRGSLPPDVGVLSELQYLNAFQNNLLVGQLPDALSLLSNLRTLIIARTGISLNPLPAGGLPSLVTLDAADMMGPGNGRSPATFFNFGNLTTMRLTGMRPPTGRLLPTPFFSGPTPPVLQSLDLQLSTLTVLDDSICAVADSLRVLTLSLNWLATLPDCIASFGNLTALYCDRMFENYGDTTASFRLPVVSRPAMRSLTTASFSSSRLADLGNILEASPLSVLTATSNRLTRVPASLFTAFGPRASWAIWDFGDNRLGPNSLPPWIFNGTFLPGLGVIRLSNNALDRLPVIRQRSLTRLDLSYAGLSAFPECADAGACPALRFVYADYNSISNLPGTAFRGMNLAELSLTGCRLASIGPHGLNSSVWPLLSRLRLNSNRLSTLPELLTTSPQLMEFLLDGNSLTATGVSPAVFTSLRGTWGTAKLTLSNNPWSNALPRGLNNSATRWTTVECTNCTLVDFPSVLCDMPGLDTLLLSANGMRSLHPCLARGGAASLTSLDLSSNQLASLPSSLRGFTVNSTINCSVVTGGSGGSGGVSNSTNSSIAGGSNSSSVSNITNSSSSNSDGGGSNATGVVNSTTVCTPVTVRVASVPPVLPSLRTLNVAGNWLQLDGLAQLLTLPLQSLDASRNDLFGVLPLQSIFMAQGLRTLDLSYGRLLSLAPLPQPLVVMDASGVARYTGATFRPVPAALPVNAPTPNGTYPAIDASAGLLRAWMPPSLTSLSLVGNALSGFLAPASYSAVNVTTGMLSDTPAFSFDFRGNSFDCPLSLPLLCNTGSITCRVTGSCTAVRPVSVSPAILSADAVTLLTVDGHGFTSQLACVFFPARSGAFSLGSSPALGFSGYETDAQVVNPTRLTCNTPAGAALNGQVILRIRDRSTAYTDGGLSLPALSRPLPPLTFVAGCPPGYAQQNVSSTQVLPSGDVVVSYSIRCVECQPGSYAPAFGTPECLLSPAGAEQPETRATGYNVCPATQYAPTPGTIRCRSCGIGTAGPSPGMSACIPCPPGRYSGDPDNPLQECAICPPGSYAGGLASTACSDCGLYAYAPLPETGNCSACPPNSYADTRNGAVRSECLCAAGFWGPPGGPCQPCPSKGALCERNSPYPRALKGFWVDSVNEPLSFIPCEPDYACLGWTPGNNATCSGELQPLRRCTMLRWCIADIMLINSCAGLIYLS